MFTAGSTRMVRDEDDKKKPKKKKGAKKQTLAQALKETQMVGC